MNPGTDAPLTLMSCMLLSELIPLSAGSNTANTMINTPGYGLYHHRFSWWDFFSSFFFVNFWKCVWEWSGIKNNYILWPNKLGMPLVNSGQFNWGNWEFANFHDFFRDATTFALNLNISPINFVLNRRDNTYTFGSEQTIFCCFYTSSELENRQICLCDPFHDTLFHIKSFWVRR